MEDPLLYKEQFYGLSKKHKNFRPDSVLFHGEAIEWIKKCTLRDAILRKKYWILLLCFITFFSVLVVEPLILHFAASFTTYLMPFALIPLFPLLIIPIAILYNTDMINVVTNYRVLQIEVTRSEVVSHYLSYPSIGSVADKSRSISFLTHNPKGSWKTSSISFHYLSPDEVAQIKDIVEQHRIVPPTPPPSRSLKIQSPRFQYELPDQFVDFLRKLKNARGDESKWIYIPSKYEMWRNSAIIMFVFCIIVIWVTCIIVLHFIVHHQAGRHFFANYILIIVPAIGLLTWFYYNLLLGKVVTTLVLTEKHILTMGYGLWFLISNTYRNGLYFMVSIPIAPNLNIVHTKMDVKTGAGRLWVTGSTAPFAMPGPDVMLRAEIIFRKQCEMTLMAKGITSSPSSPSSPSSSSPSSPAIGGGGGGGAYSPPATPSSPPPPIPFLLPPADSASAINSDEPEPV